MELSLRHWIALSTIYTVYIIFGAIVYYRMERKAEIVSRRETLRARTDVNELLVLNVAVDNLPLQNEIMSKLADYCDKPMTNYSSKDLEEPYKWSFYHAIMFAFVICSTLGYGATPPTMTFTRLFTIGYLIIGVPMNGILFAYMGNYFRSGYTSIYDRYKAKKADCDDGGLAASQVSFVTQIFFTLIPASVLLIFVPSYIFCYFEGWSYTISVYYCLETLMMIGLGDYIPTFQPDQAQKFGIYSLFYDIFVLIWLMFGLTYFLMLITLIAKGMQSKRMARLNEKLTKNILSTHNRIWHGVMNDVGFMRNLLTEAYVMKAEEECWRNFEHRSASCPDLTMYSASRSLRQRKRSYSIHLCENIDNSISGLRPFNIKQIEEQSKSDPLLQMIDALATFEVRNAPQVTGINLFSDSDITMDERPAIARDPNYGWGRLMKHMGKFKSGTNDSMYRENDNRPMTSVMDVVNRVMKRRRYDLSSDAGHPINSEPSTSTQPMAEPLEKHATFSARRRFPRVALKRHAHSFPGRSLQNQAEYQATTIADLVRAIEAMHVKEQTEESLRDLSLNGADVPPAMLRTATTAFASGSRRNRMLSEPTSASKRWNRPQQHQIGNGGLDAGRKPLQGSHVHNIALETAIRAVHWRRHARHAQTAYVPTNFEKQN